MQYLIGSLKILLFHSDSNGFTSCKCQITSWSDDVDEDLLKQATKSNLVTLTGYFIVPKKDVEYKFYGEFGRHPKYGPQFQVTTVEVSKSDSVSGVVAYLSSGLFEGIGPVSAQKIVDELGVDAIQKIKDDELALEGILPTRKAQIIRRTLIESSNNEELLIEICNLGFSPIIGMKIIKFYESAAMMVFKENPYKMVDDIQGLGFETVDIVAVKNGFSFTDERRVKSLVIHVLRTVCNMNGQTYLTVMQLLSEIAKYDTSKHLQKEDVMEALKSLINTKDIINEEDRVYDKILYRCEVNIANKLREIAESNYVGFDFNVLDQVEEKLGIKYSKNQVTAIEMALKEKSFVLTGGPGTGKTTVVKGIIEALKMNGFMRNDFALLAPTGRAAKRLSEQTGLVASTIHRYLGYDGDSGFDRDEHNQVDEKIIIVDESSMIDLYLFNQLLKAIKPHAKFILVGDDDQLPSVGPGQILKDIIESGLVKVNKLTEIHRQSLDSNIVRLAHCVRTGEDPRAILAEKKDVSFIPCSSQQFPEMLFTIMNSATNKGNTLDNIQILAPMYRGNNTGIDDINVIMQENFNKGDLSVKQVGHGDRIFRVGDKVIQSKNRAAEGVMNGDVGYILDILEANQTEDKELNVLVQFDEEIVRYRRSDLIELTHAYAITIHKSQGSEYPIVLLPVFPSYSIMLKRKLIYTAITRAKKSLVIIGNPESLMTAINTVETERQSTLLSRIKKTGHFTKVKKINDPDIPFDEDGEENMEEITPYSFL